MSIVTFWSNGKEQTGKTISIAAISTYMAIKHNIKILVVSTSDRDKTIRNCYSARPNGKTNTFGMFAVKDDASYAMQTGLEGVVKMARSNKLEPQMIRNYTKVVFNNALEVLYCGTSQDSTGDLSTYYPEVIRTANQYYDMVIVDLDRNLNREVAEEIINDSDLIVATINQKISSVDEFIKERKEDQLLRSRKTLILLGQYNKFSKFTAKNISRYMKEMDLVLTVPFNTQLHDAAEEAGVPDLFLNYAKNPNIDKEADNTYLFTESERAGEEILARLKELELNA